MKQIETEILIQTKPAKVWEAMTDFAHMGTWNPFIVEILGEGRVGANLKITLQMKPGQTTVFKPVVKVWEENRKFEWLGHLWFKGLFDGNHYFHLEETPEGHTRFIHGERFSGILVGLVMAMVGKDTLRNFHAMNAALKEKAEAKVTSA